MENLEIWKDAPGYEGLYKVSSHGRIISLSIRKHGQEMAPYIQLNSKGGYKRYYFTKEGKKKAISGHIFVARLFVPNPLNLPEVNHIDNDRTNNHYLNLEWTTRKGNCEHASRQKRYRIAKGADSPHAKLDDKKVIEIRASSLPISFFADKFGVDPATVHAARIGKTWAHVKANVQTALPLK